jgi:hypothetical protein
LTTEKTETTLAASGRREDFLDRSADAPLFFIAVALLVLPILVAFALFEWWRAARAMRSVRRALAGEIDAGEPAPEAVARLVGERMSLAEQLLRLRKRVEPLPELEAENARLREEVEALRLDRDGLRADLEERELRLRQIGERPPPLPDLDIDLDLDIEAERLREQMRDAMS